VGRPLPEQSRDDDIGVDNQTHAGFNAPRAGAPRGRP
jgi:hypothetical protein